MAVCTSHACSCCGLLQPLVVLVVSVVRVLECVGSILSPKVCCKSALGVLVVLVASLHTLHPDVGQHMHRREKGRGGEGGKSIHPE